MRKKNSYIQNKKGTSDQLIKVSFINIDRRNHMVCSKKDFVDYIKQLVATKFTSKPCLK